MAAGRAWGTKRWAGIAAPLAHWRERRFEYDLAAELAATAIEHDLILVTRNTRDFSAMPVQVIDPWSS
jgi:predicted nucleic acid-binding protein